MDALTALRAASMRGELPPKESGDNYILDGATFAKTLETPLKSANSYLTLECLVHCLATASLGIGDYIKSAQQNKMQRVAFMDRGEILKYLQGESDWTDRIDSERPKESTSETQPQEQESKEEAGTSGDSKKRKRSEKNISPSEVLLRRIKKREGSQRDRDSILQSAQRFTEALTIERDSRKNKGDRARGKNAPTVSAGKGLPIIVVPAAMTAPINMFNVKSFLEDGVYISPQEARKSKPVKEQAIHVDRRLGEHGLIRFKVVDSVRKFQDQHWDRLAAVLTQGPTWQFKDWRWKNTATIFDNCRGLHVYFDDSKLEPHIKNWNVIPFPLKKQSRHQDAVEVHKMWLEIERFLTTRKPGLLMSGKIKS